jgi:hypothetical protein
MTNRFMISVAAAALIAGTGFASAQGTGPGRDAPAGSTVQQSAPSSERPSMNRNDASDKAAPAAKTTQSDEKMQPQGGKNLRAQDDMKVAPKGEKSAQDNNLKGEKSKSMSSETNQKGPAAKEKTAQDNDLKGEKSKSMSSETNQKGPAAKDMKADSKGAADSKSQTTTQSQTGTSVQSQTTGQAGAVAKLSTEQRTQITTVIRDQHVQPLTSVNFSIAVGTRVPRDVRFHSLPREVVTIYPEWRGYEYILVNNQILVVDPRTFEIVAILDV